MRSLNYEKVAGRAAKFMQEQVAGAGADGVAFGLSGGIDSAVTAFLAKRALGDRCLALIMPNQSITPNSETDDGLLVARELGIKHVVVPIRPICEAAAGSAQADARVTGNLNARIRAVLLYYHAQMHNYLVAGTDDKSEYLIGYFTKYGDGASDMLPIASLYKTEVQELGRFLGVPEHIVTKNPSPHLWKGHDAASEIGMGYGTVDQILEGMEAGLDAAGIAERLSIDQELAERVVRLHDSSRHKRAMPPVADLNS